MEKQYDYLIVGAGLYGAVFAYKATQNGKKCLVIDRRPHIGGNLYCENIAGINVHQYGPHIFHTSDIEIWNFVNSIVPFNRFINEPLANYKGEIYPLPFNLNTFDALWGVKTAEEAQTKIEEQRLHLDHEPQNLEEQALSLVGRDVYEKPIKGYTEKQWGRPCHELPAFIIKRLPGRFTFDNNYFNDMFQGIPMGGYTKIIEKMLDGIDVRLNTDYKDLIKEEPNIAKNIIYSGCIDEFFDYTLGELQYRSLDFETTELNTPDFQGNAVVTYTEREVPFTRIIEHKHFEFGKTDTTIITKEYPMEWSKGLEPYYPVNDDKNNKLYEEYLKLAEALPNVHFGGRLGKYKYYDMDKVIEAALADLEALI